MARRKTAADPRAAVAAAGMKLVGERGWRSFSVGAVAEEAGLSLAEVYGVCADAAEFVAAVGAVMDRHMAENLPAPDPAERARDRVFDAVMARFDAMAPHKLGFDAMWRGLRRDPMAAGEAARVFRRSMTWTLEAAGVNVAGLAGAVRLRGFGLLWLRVFQTWLEDDEGQAQTMAELDRRLRRAGWLFGRDRSASLRPEPDGEPQAAE